MENKIIEIVNKILSKKELPLIQVLNPKDDLRNDLGFDSFDLAELTVRIEDEYGIDVFSNGLINTVGEILTQLNNENIF